MSRSRLILDAALVSVLGVAVLGATVAISHRDDYSFFDPLIDVKAALEARFVKELDEETLKKMQEGAIKGMIEVLEDPYTYYVPETDSSEFQKELTGEYVGIGAQINIVDKWLTIVSPLEDSPAYRAGLMAEDKVIEIEGESTYELTADECIARLQGKPGTPVRIKIERKGAAAPIEMTIIRDHIKTRSVKGFHRDPMNPEEWQFMIDPARGIAYVRLAQFTPACARELAEALFSVGAERGHVKGLILDLRNNPGGLLDDAVRISDFFLRTGRIVSTEGRGGPDRIENAAGPGTLPDFPMIVMVNGNSASASEVVAGALQDNNRAVILGSRTFGKGSVQSVIPLSKSPDGAQLRVTEQYYYLPSGRLLHRTPDSASWGVDPTPGFYISTSDQEEVEMFLARREQEIIRDQGSEDAEDWSNPEWITGRLKDRQLAGAIRAMQAKIDTGQWDKPGEPGIAGVQIALDELNDAKKAQEQYIRELQRLQKRIDALESATGPVLAQTEPPFDFWPDSLDLTGGQLRVYDKDGNEITTLKITGNRLERWLIDADVEKVEPVQSAPATETP